MATIVTVTWCALSALVFVASAIQGQRLLSRFKRDYPDIAEKEIPYVFEGMRHPEQLLFFYRKRAAEVLKNDEHLLKMRRCFTFLLTLSVLIPLGGFIVVVVVVRFFVQSG